MALTLTSLIALHALDLDEVIDVRSPSEYAEDHIPGAVNLPVLNDAERAEVGTIYVRESRFRARKVGAALVAQNAARHLQTYLADKPGGYRPLVYCWRGGQRSNSFATILAQIGWRVEVLEGGYQSYRRLVARQLYECPFPCKVFLLDGNTGSAKTDLLLRLPGHGVQVLDLEGLAHHRGSLFGARAGGQPSQKGFESRLAAAIAGLDPARPVVIEAESSRIGQCTIPPQLWEVMKPAQRIEIIAPLAERAKYLTRAYADLIADPALLVATIRRLAPLHAAKQIDDWQNMARQGHFAELAASLMETHYDPRYSKQRARRDPANTRLLPLESLSDTALDKGAAALAERVAELSDAPLAV